MKSNWMFEKKCGEKRNKKKMEDELYESEE